MMKTDTGTGVLMAFGALCLLGVMPIISNSRPALSDALTFAFFLSLWQLVFSLPLLIRELTSANKGIFASALPPALMRRTMLIILVTGAIFGASTYLYVLAVEKAGAVSAAIAIQAYPLFAILWETLFLKKPKSKAELLLTSVILLALYYLATQGSWRVEGLSVWFLAALGIPFLWSSAHVVIKEVLNRTPITPAQVTFFRVLVSSLFLAGLLVALRGWGGLTVGWADVGFQKTAMIMGLVYYLQLIFWFHSIRRISVSLASTITVPWPMLTMILTVVLLHEAVEGYQVAAFAVVAASIYGLIFLGSKKACADGSGIP
ncbi:MAG: drug/metabolite transporter (DMT)-like permease [Paracoccaceae bacterium]|jgi:drug/metabolite transporter (DMT)-like permease